MKHLSLRELNRLIRDTLDTHLEPSYWVVAEISELRVNQKGHCYMELVEKENDELIAKTKAIIWAYNFRNLSNWFESKTGKQLKPGMKILVNAIVQFHELYGMSLIIRDIDPGFTLGERARKRQEIIDRLKIEGIFDLNKGQLLPIVPQRIAIISSPTAAGYGDFQNQLMKNPFGYTFQVQLFRSIMQGEAAAGGIIAAFERIEKNIRDFDLITIIRGGGSQVDLDCFNSYDVCSKIAKMPLPVITGIGHERDETIADLVAHTSLKTPTAVSEFLIDGMSRFDIQLDEYLTRIKNRFQQKLRFEEFQINEYRHRLRQLFHMAMKNKEYKLDGIQKSLASAIKSSFTKKRIQLEGLETRLTLLDPAQILKRGYTITSIDNKLVSKAEKIEKGDKISTYTNKLVIDSTVDKSVLKQWQRKGNSTTGKRSIK